LAAEALQRQIDSKAREDALAAKQAARVAEDIALQAKIADERENARKEELAQGAAKLEKDAADISVNQGEAEQKKLPILRNDTADESLAEELDKIVVVKLQQDKLKEPILNDTKTVLDEIPNETDGYTQDQLAAEKDQGDLYTLKIPTAKNDPNGDEEIVTIIPDNAITEEDKIFKESLVKQRTIIIIVIVLSLLMVLISLIYFLNTRSKNKRATAKSFFSSDPQIHDFPLVHPKYHSSIKASHSNSTYTNGVMKSFSSFEDIFASYGVNDDNDKLADYNSFRDRRSSLPDAIKDPELGVNNVDAKVMGSFAASLKGSMRSSGVFRDRRSSLPYVIKNPELGVNNLDAKVIGSFAASLKGSMRSSGVFRDRRSSLPYVIKNPELGVNNLDAKVIGSFAASLKGSMRSSGVFRDRRSSLPYVLKNPELGVNNLDTNVIGSFAASLERSMRSSGLFRNLSSSDPELRRNGLTMRSSGVFRDTEPFVIRRCSIPSSVFQHPQLRKSSHSEDEFKSRTKSSFYCKSVRSTTSTDPYTLSICAESPIVNSPGHTFSQTFGFDRHSPPKRVSILFDLDGLKNANSVYGKRSRSSTFSILDDAKSEISEFGKMDSRLLQTCNKNDSFAELEVDHWSNMVIGG
jgi:hypothetical protein